VHEGIDARHAGTRIDSAFSRLRLPVRVNQIEVDMPSTADGKKQSVYGGRLLILLPARYVIANSQQYYDTIDTVYNWHAIRSSHDRFVS
jgi:hypothetical protein